jgi:hypothetical protein|tara:strand:- start:1974 stop:2630 length:657 start_codon:yes stop_codon:yes gene_type:complete
MSNISEISSVVPTQKDIITETKSQYNNLKLQTNRYKFSKEIIDLLEDFAKLHQYEGSKDYKESWSNWIKEDEISRELEEEQSRLVKQGIIGDVMERLYKSSRYYYRKKIHKPESAPKTRKKYEGLSKEVLRNMDAQIIREINGNIDMSENEKIISRFTPSKSFESYINENPDSVNDLITDPADSAQEDRFQRENALQKLKKTYKNRFYKIKVSLEKQE